MSYNESLSTLLKRLSKLIKKIFFSSSTGIQIRGIINQNTKKKKNHSILILVSGSFIRSSSYLNQFCYTSHRDQHRNSEEGKTLWACTSNRATHR